MSKAINFVKDAFIWQADFVQVHPWTSVALIWALALSALVF